MPDDKLEIELGALEGRVVVGVDEVGRGPLAGPVVAAAVVFDLRRLPSSLRLGLNDSKLLKPAQRAELAAAVPDYARTAIASATAAEVDNHNVLRASLLAMQRAVLALEVAADCVLVDGNQPPPLECDHRCLVGGDGLSLSVAAASVIAKVHRDSLMEELAERHRGYGWERNRGYGTQEHLLALRELGPCGEHRRSFAPVRELLLATT